MQVHDDVTMDRHLGLGGSDAGAVLGVSPWTTRVELYLEKIGQGRPRPQTKEMARGKQLEALVADMAAEQLGLRFRRRNKRQVHRDLPWMIGHLDREVIGKRILVEVKTERFQDDEWGPDGSDQIPEVYLAQVVHYMAVRRFYKAYVPVLFVGQWKLHIYEIGHDRGLEDILIGAEDEFWHEHVLKQVPPLPVTVEDYTRLWPRDDGDVRYASDDLLATVAELRGVKAEGKDLKDQQTALENRIKGYLGERGTLLDNESRALVTWLKAKDREQIDWEAVARRLFRGDFVEPGLTIEAYAQAWGCAQTKEGSRSFLLRPPKKQKGANAQKIGTTRLAA